ncbi:hypothetical protein BGX30_008440, partial [Mortierella sp. GBA39]
MPYSLDDYEFDQDDEDENPVLHRPFLLDTSIDARRYSDEYCVQEFWFNCAQLEEILEVLQVPPRIKSRNRDSADSLKVPYMAIYRLSYLARLNRMETMFRRGTSAVSRLINHPIKWIMLRRNLLLIWDHHRLTPTSLEEYAELCSEKSNHECNAVFGFINGT